MPTAFISGYNYSTERFPSLAPGTLPSKSPGCFFLENLRRMSRWILAALRDRLCAILDEEREAHARQDQVDEHADRIGLLRARELIPEPIDACAADHGAAEQQQPVRAGHGRDRAHLRPLRRTICRSLVTDHLDTPQ